MVSRGIERLSQSIYRRINMEHITNMNDTVKVKLSEIGIARLKELHESLNETVRQINDVGIKEWELKFDDEGYYKTQLWRLFQDFGDMIGVAKQSPFESIDLIIFSR
jgi:hypothetical protein